MPLPGTRVQFEWEGVKLRGHICSVAEYEADGESWNPCGDSLPVCVSWSADPKMKEWLPMYTGVEQALLAAV